MNNKKLIKLNFGSGEKYLDDYINCDHLSTIKADKVLDLNRFPYPFKDSYVDEILMDNVLEHLDDIVKVMDEIHRILKKGGVLRIYVPYGKSDWAMQDPTHKHFFTERSMNYFSEGFDTGFYTKNKFRILKAELFCGSDTLKSRLRNLIPLKSLFKYYFYNIYDGIYFEMQPIKIK